MKEYQRKIVEGLKLLIDGLLDDVEDLRISVDKGEKDVLRFRIDEIKDYLKKAERTNYFPRDDLEILKLKYNAVNIKINKK